MKRTVYECDFENCGEERKKTNNWFIVRHNTDGSLAVMEWTQEAADEPGAKLLCGIDHLQRYVGMWADRVEGKTGKSCEQVRTDVS